MNSLQQSHGYLPHYVHAFFSLSVLSSLYRFWQEAVKVNSNLSNSTSRQLWKDFSPPARKFSTLAVFFSAIPMKNRVFSNKSPTKQRAEDWAVRHYLTCLHAHSLVEVKRFIQFSHEMMAESCWPFHLLRLLDLSTSDSAPTCQRHTILPLSLALTPHDDGGWRAVRFRVAWLEVRVGISSEQ